MKRIATALSIAALGLLLAACLQQTGGELGAQDVPGTYLLTSNGLPADFADVVAANGDMLNALHIEAGFASVTTDRPDAYRRFTSTIVRDVTFSQATFDGEPVVFEVSEVTDASFDAIDDFPYDLRGSHDLVNVQIESAMTDIVEPPFTGDDDFLFDLQWGHDAVNTQAAWARGHRGAGVRVAILDGGTDVDHPDLAPNSNFALSVDFTGQGLQYACDDPFSHAAHIGGIVAAADNAVGTIGVAPEAELVWVKVLSDVLPPERAFNCIGIGTFATVIEGIYYSADIGADVIKMSLGDLVLQGQGRGSDEIAALRVTVNHAITYAENAGATVIVAAGNNGIDLNSPEAASVIQFNSFASHAVSISGVGPLGWATDPGNTDLDTRAPYTNIGAGIDFAAPGGNFVYPGIPSSDVCRVAGETTWCFVFDQVLSTGNVDSGRFGCSYRGGCWYWSTGTSQAAAYASGIAALFIGEHGGDLKPVQVRRIMRQRADDLGPNGVDFLYGHGRVASGY
jgi:subtilisin family serine protease